jgi:hypothetical protein
LVLPSDFYKKILPNSVNQPTVQSLVTLAGHLVLHPRLSRRRRTAPLPGSRGRRRAGSGGRRRAGGRHGRHARPATSGRGRWRGRRPSLPCRRPGDPDGGRSGGSRQARHDRRRGSGRRAGGRRRFLSLSVLFPRFCSSINRCQTVLCVMHPSEEIERELVSNCLIRSRLRFRHEKGSQSCLKVQPFRRFLD